MAGLIDWYKSDAQNLHPIDRAAQLHTRFVEIHPFKDGNGRTARLLLNLELMREGYPVAIILREDRLEYFDALEKSCVDREYGDFTRMVARCVARSLDLYLEVVTGKKPALLKLDDSEEQYLSRIARLSDLERAGHRRSLRQLFHRPDHQAVLEVQRTHKPVRFHPACRA